MECLKSSSHAAASDQSLVAWVKLVKIAEEMGTLLSYDDPGNIPTASDSRGKLLLKNFKRDLTSWERDTSSNVMNGNLQYRVPMYRESS